MFKMDLSSFHGISDKNRLKSIYHLDQRPKKKDFREEKIVNRTVNRGKLLLDTTCLSYKMIEFE